MQKTEPITAKDIRASDDFLVLVLEDREVKIAWPQCSARLASAAPEQRKHAELSKSGYGIHWPLIDEDLSIGGLLESASHREPV